MRRTLIPALLLIACQPAPAPVAPPPPPPATVATVFMSLDTARLNLGDSIQLTAVGRDAHGVDLTGHAVSWMTESPLIASVSSTGRVTAIREGGPLHITATIDNISASVTVIVSVAIVAQISMSPTGPLALLPGASDTLHALPVSAAGTPVLGANLVWASSDRTIATMTITGATTAIVTAVSAGGPVQITVTASSTVGTKTTLSEPATVIVTVLPPPLSVTPPTLALPLGTSTQLSATTPTGPPSGAVTWQSSDPTVATVSLGGGLVTAVSAGPVTITATSLSGSTTLTATARISVSAPLAAPIAYALADQPFAASYTPDANWQFNQLGAPITVSRLGAGQYAVTVPGFGAPAGGARLPFAGAVDSTGAYCVAVSWNMVGVTDATVRVDCATAAGVPMDSKFSVFAIGEDRLPGHRLVFASSGPATAFPAGAGTQLNLTGSSSTWSSRGSTLGLVRNGADINIGFDAANNSDNYPVVIQASGNATNHCQISSSSASVVTSRCRQAGTGTQVDAQFNTMVIGDGRFGQRFGANSPSSRNSSGGSTALSVDGNGHYRVSFFGLGRSTAQTETVLVSSTAGSPAIAGATRCQASAPWTTTGTTLTVSVICFNASGQPANVTALSSLSVVLIE